jgi:predicted nucleic acid-binding Zn ribbon protein
MKESPKIKCNKCGGNCVKVITGGAGIIFNGPDWVTNEGRQIVKTATGESIDMSKHDG